jgi:hypothetical protein
VNYLKIKNFNFRRGFWDPTPLTKASGPIKLGCAPPCNSSGNGGKPVAGGSGL